MEEIIFRVLAFVAGIIELFWPKAVWKITYSFWSVSESEPSKLLLLLTRLVGLFFIFVALAGLFYDFFTK